MRSGPGHDGAEWAFMEEQTPSLVSRCAAGDARAWKQLVDQYAGLVYAVARRHRLKEDACDDVAQTSFAALSRHIGSIADDRAIAAWLRVTATRESWRAARRARGPAELAAEPAHDDPPLAAALDRAEQHQRLRDALEELGGLCRNLLYALYFGPERGAYDRVSAALNMPHGSIGPTRRRCLAKLAELFSRPWPDPAG